MSACAPDAVASDARVIPFERSRRSISCSAAARRFRMASIDLKPTRYSASLAVRASGSMPKTFVNSSSNRSLISRTNFSPGTSAGLRPALTSTDLVGLDDFRIYPSLKNRGAHRSQCLRNRITPCRFLVGWYPASNDY
ncbi:hypothetical protein ebA5946 [Aromatoleum aromaticum EbN1]|uniref:Uncharacterized protein n=1 Tax=Aromatoleum aromaticum (strain DSM 19018 / LMG 30748 / EbN1) TaxID=76114 RepID=Q5NZK4_AROAE|nr:hypothetical protein ebA5946 [Aromatoleum aromaticum EbN1]